MLKFVAALNDYVEVVTLAGTQLRTVAASVTRTPDSHIEYAAGDVVGGPSLLTTAAITFTNIGVAGEVVRITGSRLAIGLAAIPTTMSSFKLHLYNITPPSALLDNAAWDLPAGDVASYCGSIALGTPADLGSTLYIATSNINLDVQMGATNNLYGYLVTTDIYEPAISTLMGITLLAQNI